MLNDLYSYNNLKKWNINLEKYWNKLEKNIIIIEKYKWKIDSII